MNARQQITDLLVHGWEDEREILDRLYPLVYEELRRIAHRQLRGERTGHTLNTTALVDEAYLRLVDQTRAGWTDRARFFGLAARAMRRVLIDHARKHRAAKRGGCKVVECRFFGGLTQEETAAALGVAVRTVKRDWVKAKSWLYQEIYADESP